MADIRMGPAETQFAEIIWENEPIASGALSKKAEEALHWKKTTSFTVLKRLCERGIFQNQGGMVTSLISREEFFARHSEQYVQIDRCTYDRTNDFPIYCGAEKIY